MGWGDIAKPWTYPEHFVSGVGKLFGDPEGLSEDEKADKEARRLQMQTSLAGLRQQAAGKSSIAAEQLRQGLQQNVAAQQSLAASARPGQQGMAQRMASQQAGKMGAELSGQQALARLMEQKQAQQLEAEMLARLRGQDYGLEQIRMQQPTGADKFLGAASGGLQAGLTSDIRAKENIQTGDAEAQKMLDALKAQKYRYRDEGRHGTGQQLGIMAQDLEKSRMGQQAVSASQDGTKMVDTGKLTMGLAAGMAQMNDRLKKVEGGGQRDLYQESQRKIGPGASVQDPKSEWGRMSEEDKLKYRAKKRVDRWGEKAIEEESFDPIEKYVRMEVERRRMGK